MFVLVDSSNQLVSTHKTIDEAFAARKPGTSIKLAADWKR